MIYLKLTNGLRWENSSFEEFSFIISNMIEENGYRSKIMCVPTRCSLPYFISIYEIENEDNFLKNIGIEEPNHTLILKLLRDQKIQQILI